MRIGFVGLGRMGANMVRRLLRDGHEVVAYNRTPEKTKEIAGEGATAAFSIGELVDKLEKPRAVWIMVPAGDATEAQIEELMEHLEPGDTITVFSKADFSLPRTQQANQIRLEGEVAMAGVYTALPGETLRDLVLRAGGLTPNAYLYGAQFTRESTRREQQKRFGDFLSQLERETNESAANLSGRVTSAEQAATAAC